MSAAAAEWGRRLPVSGVDVCPRVARRLYMLSVALDVPSDRLDLETLWKRRSKGTAARYTVLWVERHPCGSVHSAHLDMTF